MARGARVAQGQWAMLNVGDSLQQGRFVIERVLGEGGMGSVYLARVAHLGDKRVAIKEVSAGSCPPSELPRARAQLREEAGLLARLSHPGLAEVMDHFEDGGNEYIVMAYVPGRTLETVLRDAAAPPPVSQVLDWADQVCDVLCYLHRQEPPILLRDVKPANIILEPGGRVRLIDFGIARTLDGNTATRTFIRGAGSAGYAPIEQYGVKPTDERTDIYGLGATIYSLLTRTIPPTAIDRFSGESDLPQPSTFNPHVPGALDAVVVRMMALRREDRYASVAQARAALHEASAGVRDQAGEMAPVSGTGAGVVDFAPAPPTVPQTRPRVGPATLPHTVGLPQVFSGSLTSVGSLGGDRPARAVAIMFLDLPQYATLRNEEQLRVRVEMDPWILSMPCFASLSTDEFLVDTKAGNCGVVVFLNDLAGPLELALALQESACREPWRRLGVRMGLHVGTVLLEETTAVGAAVNMGQRVAYAGKPGDIMASASYLEMLRSLTDRYDHLIGALRDVEVKHGKVISMARIGSDAAPAAGPAARYRLDVVAGGRGAGGTCCPLDKSPLVVGRDVACDVRFDDAGISRRHATLECRDGTWWLRHESRVNPTLVNDVPVVGEQRLEAGDRIQLSRDTTLVLAQENVP